eukprot:4363407-Pyramimonas_sp.AAC.1
MEPVIELTFVPAWLTQEKYKQKACRAKAEEFWSLITLQSFISNGFAAELYEKHVADFIAER